MKRADDDRPAEAGGEGRVADGAGAARVYTVAPGEPFLDRLAAAPDPAAEGVAIAAEQVSAYLQIAQGVHLMAIKAEERIPAILQQAGLKPLALG